MPSQGRTVKEANVNLSLDYRTQFLKTPFQRAQQYSHLTLQDFKINEVEKTSLNYLSSVLFEYSIQCNIVQSSLSEEAIFLQSFRKRFSISSPRLEHQSQITYLQTINVPDDKKETILKVLSFLYNVHEVNTSVNYLLVIGDAKTFELLHKLKDEYGQDLEWLISYPREWHILKNFQPVVFKIFGHAGLRSIAQRAGVEEGTLRLVPEFTNFKKTNVFLIQCYFTIIHLKISAFLKSSSMTTEMSDAISSLLNLLLKFKKTGEDKKSEYFNDMQTEISALFYHYPCIINFLIIV